MNNFFGYIRVSTQEQKESGVSLDNQREKIKSYAQLKDMNLVGIIEDAGKSGKSIEREGLQQLLELCKQGKVEGVIVYKLDRLSRRTRDLLFLIEDIFNKNNIALHSLNESIDTQTSQGKFFLTVIAGLAEMERNLIAERTKDALQSLKNKDRKLGSPDFAPLGYKFTKRKKAKVKDLEPTEDIGTVKEIYKLRNNKLSYGDIARKLGMAKSSVWYICNNDIYNNLLGLSVQ